MYSKNFYARYSLNPLIRVLKYLEIGGSFVNLQVANHVIHVEMPINQAIKTQRRGRVRRAGSDYDTAFEYDFVTEGSVDVSSLEKIKKESLLFSGLVDHTEEESEALKSAHKRD